MPFMSQAQRQKFAQLLVDRTISDQTMLVHGSVLICDLDRKWSRHVLEFLGQKGSYRHYARCRSSCRTLRG
jgi:hypothetical protein